MLISIKQNSFTVSLLNSVFRTIRDVRLIKRDPAGNQSHTNVVVISLHRLGDTVFTIPAMKLLAAEFGDRLRVVCFKSSAAIYAKAMPDLETTTLENKDFISGRIARFSARTKISKLNPGMIIDLTGVITSASLIAAQKAVSITGLSEVIYAGFYTASVAHRTMPHLTDRYIDAIRDVVKRANPDDVKMFPLSYTPKSGKILICPFAGWEAKQWGMKKFLALGIELSRNYRCVFIGEDGQFSGEDILRFTQHNLEYIQLRSIAELMEAAERSSLFIGNDSGPLYIAVMLGVPTFSLYGPTNPEFSRPAGAHHRVFRSTIPCLPLQSEQYCRTDAGRKGCPSFDCMNLLESASVISEVKNFIEELRNTCAYNIPETIPEER
ncbi:MAG: glycosyltransferase family 9 protein [Bacteroidota bacterium]